MMAPWLRLLPTHLSDGEGPHATLGLMYAQYKKLRKNEYFHDRRLNHGTNTQLSPSPSPRRLEENICKQCATDATIPNASIEFFITLSSIYISPLTSVKKLWKLSLIPAYHPFLILERKLSNYLGADLAFGKSEWWKQSYTMIEILSPFLLQGLEKHWHSGCPYCSEKMVYKS